MQTLYNRQYSLARQHLLQSEPFYGLLLYNCAEIEDESVGTIGISATDENLYIKYNPEWIETLSITGLAETIKHCLLHLLVGHDLDYSDDLLLETAKDISINEFLTKKNLPSSFPTASKLNLAPDKSTMYYYNELCKLFPQLKQNKLGQSEQTNEDQIVAETQDNLVSSTGDVENSLKNDKSEPPNSQKNQNNQGNQNKSQNSQPNKDLEKKKSEKKTQQKPKNQPSKQVGDKGITSQQNVLLKNSNTDNHNELAKTADINPSRLDNLVKSAIIQASGNQGAYIPNNLKDLEYIKFLLKQGLPWNVILKNFIALTSKTIRQLTWKKPSRRMGEDYKGVKKKQRLRGLVCLDESGSVGNDEWNAFVNEIHAIWQTKHIELTVIKFTSHIEKVFEYTGKQDDVLHHRYSGGTSFQPLFDFAEEQKPDFMVILTDGYNFDGVCKYSRGKTVLWCLTPEGKEHPEFGKTLKIELD